MQQTAPASNVTFYAAAPPQPAPTQQPHPQQAQPPPRAILPQRRPTNAIPIVSPPDRGGKGRGRLVGDASVVGTGGGDFSNEAAAPAAKGGDDIDHILDNMFVRRPQQPGQAATGGRAAKGDDVPVSVKGDMTLDEGMKASFDLF